MMILKMLLNACSSPWNPPLWLGWSPCAKSCRPSVFSFTYQTFIVGHASHLLSHDCKSRSCSHVLQIKQIYLCSIYYTHASHSFSNFHEYRSMPPHLCIGRWFNVSMESNNTCDDIPSSIVSRGCIMCVHHVIHTTNTSHLMLKTNPVDLQGYNNHEMCLEKHCLPPI